MDISPLILSLKTASAATVITFFTGIAAAAAVIKMKHGKAVIDTIFTLPMILPPTVVGFFLLLLFGKNTAFGAWLQSFGVSIVFSWSGTVIASAVVSFPLMYRTARSAFEQMNPELLYAGRTLGMTEWRIFWKVILPNCLPGILGGTILSFARALGEFGATIMLAGNIPGKTQTLAIAVYSAMQNGDREQAYRLVAIIVLISFVAIFSMHLVNKSQMKYMARRS